MLKATLSPAEERMRENALREALKTCPRFIDLIARGRINDPDDEALIYLTSPLDESPVIISGEHLMGYVKAAENFFRAEGIGKGDTVAILPPFCPASIVAILAAATCSMVQPLNLLYTREAIAAQLNAVKAKLLLVPPPSTVSGLYERVEGLQREVPSLKRIVVMALDGSVAFDNEILTPDPDWRDDYGQSSDMSETDRVAFVLPTGGTTGEPKIAQLTNRAIVASCKSSMMAFDPRKGDRLMVPLPLFHVGGLFVGVGCGLAAGIALVIAGPAGARDPAFVPNYWKLIETYRITHAGGVPTTIGAAADIPIGDSDISSLRVTIVGASICPVEVDRRYRARWGGPCLQQIYGMTELAGGITHDIVGVQPRAEAVGTRNPLTELAVLADGKLHTGPWPSPVGELLMKGPQVFAGYLDKKQTEDAFYNGWLRSGDLCRIDGDGHVYIMGRAKDLIIRGGHNIDPRTIEDAALSYPGVALAAAVARPDSYAGEVPMLFVSAQPGASIDLTALAAFVQENILEPPARPRLVSIVDEMPVTPIGKIFKPKLREIAARDAAHELLAAEGLAGNVGVEATTCAMRGLYLLVTGAPSHAAAAKQLLERLPLKIEIEA
jgi:fatty-acyl-CoA synthase